RRLRWDAEQVRNRPAPGSRSAASTTVPIWAYWNDNHTGILLSMPRVADHDQRRALMTHAFQRILAAEGLQRVTFSKVAADAGISVGLIQHYFANKDELLRFAYEDCLRRSADRVARHITAGEAAGLPISAMLLTALTELLP